MSYKFRLCLAGTIFLIAILAFLGTLVALLLWNQRTMHFSTVESITIAGFLTCFIMQSLNMVLALAIEADARKGK